MLHERENDNVVGRWNVREISIYCGINWRKGHIYIKHCKEFRRVQSNNKTDIHEWKWKLIVVKWSTKGEREFADIWNNEVSESKEWQPIFKEHVSKSYWVRLQSLYCIRMQIFLRESLKINQTAKTRSLWLQNW